VHEYDCYGSDFIILPGTAGRASSASPSHPLFHTSILLPFEGFGDKFVFDFHHRHCCVPWSWQAVNHITAIASKYMSLSRLVRPPQEMQVNNGSVSCITHHTSSHIAHDT